MPDVRLTNPLGDGVWLTDYTWVRHVVRRHPEVGPYRAAVEAAVISPTVVLASSSDPDCLVHYGVCEGQAGEVAVVANVRRGIVMTAYLCLRRGRGEQRWP